MANQHLDISRHKELFNPHEFNEPIHVLGCGATGSWVALQLAKLGVSDITVWDFDAVEEHNVPNQAFGIAQIGKSKVDALHDLIYAQVGVHIKTRNERVTDQRLEGIVFLMVDSMSAREEIWNKCIKFKPAVKHLIEPRMGMSVGRVYNVNPMKLNEIRAYEDTYYGDDVAEVSSCGTSLTVITSAMATASWCVRQFINYVDGTPLDNEILLDYQYNNIFPTKWS